MLTWPRHVGTEQQPECHMNCERERVKDVNLRVATTRSKSIGLLHNDIILTMVMVRKIL